MDETKEFCKENGYVTTIMHRRRYIKEINSPNHALREFGKRAAMNSRVQGSAADLIKVAMINIQKEIERRHLSSKMVLSIHDELIFDVPEDEVEVMKELVSYEMEHAMELSVPLKAEASVSHNWYEAK